MNRPVAPSVQGLFAADDELRPAAASVGAQIALADATSELRTLLEDPSVLKVGFNIKWDLALFLQHGLTLAPYDDPMLQSYTLFGGLDPHDKASLAEKHLSHNLTPVGEVIGKGKAQLTFDLAPVDRAAAYSAEHADAALRLWRKLKPQLARERLITVYETLERPMPPVLSAMEREGVRIDPNELSRLSGDFAQRMLQYEQEAQELAGHEFDLARRYGQPLSIIMFDLDHFKEADAGRGRSGTREGPQG